MKHFKGGRKQKQQPPPLQWQVDQLRTQIIGLQTDNGMLAIMLTTLIAEKELEERATKDGCVLLEGVHFDIKEKKFYKTAPKNEDDL